MSAVHDKIDVLNFLLQKHKAKCDINARDKLGRTALHHAAANGHVDIAKVLLANGADVNARSNGNETPLIRACMYREIGMVDLLLKVPGIDVSLTDYVG